MALPFLLCEVASMFNCLGVEVLLHNLMEVKLSIWRPRFSWTRK